MTRRGEWLEIIRGGRGEILAGYADGLRTPGARVWDGRHYGDPFYVVGYAVGILARRRGVMPPAPPSGWSW